MNINLRTENLRTSCRLCFNQGEIDIWQHYVTVPDFLDEKDYDDNELLTIELFKVFQEYDTALLSLNEELKLLCFSCLDKLTNCFIFYKRAIHSNNQIQRLYKEQSIELIVEEAEGDNSNIDDLELIHTSEDEISLNDESKTRDIEYFDSDYVEPEEFTAYISHEESNEQNVDLEPTFEATLQVDAQISDSLKDIKACDNDKTNVETNSICKETVHEIQSLKAFDSLQPHAEDVNEKPISSFVPALPPHEDGSLIVTQFLPVTAHIVLSNPTSTEEDEGGGNDDCGNKNIITPVPDLSTVEYAAVEIKSSNLNQFIEEELQSENPKPSSPQLGATENDDDQEESSNTIFVCKYCPQAFAASHYLIAHVRKSHVCKYCTQAFVKTMDLFVHIRQAHHQHKCAICNKELSSHSNLRGHIKRVHGIRLPAQVALLDYKPPSNKAVDEKLCTSNAKENEALDDMDMCF